MEIAAAIAGYVYRNQVSCLKVTVAPYAKHSALYSTRCLFLGYTVAKKKVSEPFGSMVTIMDKPILTKLIERKWFYCSCLFVAQTSTVQGEKVKLMMSPSDNWQKLFQLRR